MKIAFKRRNGCCPGWEYDGIWYYLFEDYDGSWTLMSRKKGFLKKDQFYGSWPHRIYPEALLRRFFRNKKSVKYEKKGRYSFWFWEGKQFATDGEIITVRYADRYERPSFDSYRECLKDAKEYLSQKYDREQVGSV